MCFLRDLRALALLSMVALPGLAHAQVFPEQSSSKTAEPVIAPTPVQVMAVPPTPLNNAAFSLDSLTYLRDGSLMRTKLYGDNLSLRLSLGSTFFAYDNADFRPRRVETIEDELRYSDDRSFFVETQLSAGISYAIHPEVRVDIGFRHRGLWGGRGQSAGSDTLNQQYFGYLGAFDQASIVYIPRIPKPLDQQVTLGRHNFQIGGMPREYILGDTLDGLSFRLGAGKFGAIRGMVDLFTASTLSDQSLRELQLDTSQPDRYFRGQINTIRAGGIYENVDAILPGLMLKAYYLHAEIGASDVHGTGADVSYNGTLGNFADNDYTYVYGGRAGYELKLVDTKLDRFSLAVQGDAAHSDGIDRKEAVARDVATEGNAFGGALTAYHTHGRTRWMLLGAFYHFDGAQYASDGLMFKSGFVSMNAQPMGGLATARVQGMRPSASVDASGIRYSPHDKTRYAGTQFVNLGGALSYHRTRAYFWYWTYKDTSNSYVNFAKLDQIDPPFGYSRNEFAAQKRLGKKLSQEFDFGLEQLLNDNLRIGVNAGLVTPGAFYDIDIAQVAGEQIGGQSLFWVVSAGATAWL